jgi:hypothetical protein
MGFKLHLATAFPDLTDPQLVPSGIPPFVPELLLSSPHFSDRLTFPPPGLARSMHYPSVPSGAVFELALTISVGTNVLNCSYTGLESEDSLFFWAINRFRFLGNVWHARSGQQATQCIARCADGTSAPFCVVCTSGQITAKICC